MVGINITLGSVSMECRGNKKVETQVRVDKEEKDLRWYLCDLSLPLMPTQLVSEIP